MNDQHETTKPANANVSELEMVGTLLFGSISDVSSDNESASEPQQTVKTSAASGRMINLGARIAPENERRWEEETRETVVASVSPILSAPSAAPVETKRETEVSAASEVSGTSEVSATANVSADVKPAAQTPSHENPLSRHREHSIPFVYRACFCILFVCAALLGWQTYNTEKTDSKSASSSAPAVAAASVSAPEKKADVKPISDTAFADFNVVPTFDATTPASSFNSGNSGAPTVATAVSEAQMEEEFPQFNPNMGCEMVPAQTSSAVGSPVVMSSEESCPTYNPALFDPNAAPNYVPVPVSVPASVSAQNPAVVPAPAQVASWNAGASMEEVPVYNPEISNFNGSVAHAPQVAPLAPAVGSQAQPASPRKLARPSASAQPTQAAYSAQPTQTVQPMYAAQPTQAAYSAQSAAPAAPVAVPTPVEEAYPTFNPGAGVDNALPVSYY